MQVIYAYTRREAIEDGVLVDVTAVAKDVGFRDHTVITQALHQALQDFPRGSTERYDRRLHDTLEMAVLSIMRETDVRTDRVSFPVRLLNSSYQRERHQLMAVCGPDDDGNPCMTIGFPEDF